MKKGYLITSIIFLLSIFSGRIHAQEEPHIASLTPKKRIAVINFANKTSFDDYDIGQSISDMLTTALWKTDKFVLVERAELEKVIKEQDFSGTDLVSSETAAKLGRILGLNAIVLGGITEFGYLKEKRKMVTRIGLDLRLVDVNTARIILAESAVGTAPGENADQAGRGAVDALAYKITASLKDKPWEGKIMETEATEVYINAGSKIGIVKGHIFDIIRPGKELIDPVTGKVVGAIEKKIGRVEVIQVEEEYSIAKTIGGGNFKKNDLVREIKDR